MKLSEFGRIEDNKVYRKAFKEFPERLIGEIQENEKELVEALHEKYATVEKEVEAIAEKVETESNKGSFLTKVQNLIDSLPDIDGVGDFEKLHDKLTHIKSELEAYIEANRHKNLQIKTALLEQLQPFAESSEWKSASAAVKEIQQKWIKTGAVADEHKEKIEGQFKSLIDSFYKRRNSFYADLEQMMAEKEEDFKAFLEKAKSLEKETDLKKLKERIAEFTEEWKALGKIKPQQHNAYWQDFQSIIKAAFNKARSKQKKLKSRTNEELIKIKKEILDTLEKADEMFQPKINLEEIKKKWKESGKSKSEEMELYLFLSASISEKNFIHDLANKKVKAKVSDAELLKMKVKVCRNLLERDKRELENFEENLGKFNTSSDLDKLLGGKLRQQQRKVRVKEHILQQFRAELKSKTA